MVHGAGGTERGGQQLHEGRRPGGRWGRGSGRAGGSEPGRGRQAGSRTGSQRARLEPLLPPPPPPLPSAPAGGRTGRRAPGGSGLPRQRGRREGRARGGEAGRRRGGGSAGWVRPGPGGRHRRSDLLAGRRPALGERRAAWAWEGGDLSLRLPPPPRHLACPPNPNSTANLEGTGEVTLCSASPRTSALPTLPPTGTRGPGDPRPCCPGPSLGGVRPHGGELGVPLSEGVRGGDRSLRDTLHPCS